MFYIYNNSPATAKQGFWANKKYVKSKTTLEFAFALSFDSLEDANKWLRRSSKRIGIIFERKD